MTPVGTAEDRLSSGERFHVRDQITKVGAGTGWSADRIPSHRQPVPFDAEKVSESLNAPEVRAELSCRLGKSEGTCWTCDLSKEYVTINADYHT